MKQLAPDVWTHVDRRGGVPDAVGRRPHAAAAPWSSTRSPGPRGRPRWPSSSPPRPAAVASRGREHASPLGPRVRQRRLRRRRTSSPSAAARASSRRSCRAATSPVACRRPRACPLPNVTFGDRLSYVDERRARCTSSTRRATARTRWSSSSPSAGCCSAATPSSGRSPTSASATAAEEWVRTLRQLKQLPADLIVPAHGPAMDKRIIDANERYVGRRLRGGRGRQGRRRRPRRPRPAGRAASSRTASSSTTCTRRCTARTSSGPGTRSDRPPPLRRAARASAEHE